MRIFLFVLMLAVAAVCRAQQGFAKVDVWMEDNVRTMGGHAFLVVEKDGKIVHTKEAHGLRAAYGMDSRERIASCSKWLSAALVMTFVDEGKLRLSDTVGRWLPVLTVHGKGGITVGQCLSHLTGIKEPPLRESLGE